MLVNGNAPRLATVIERAMNATVILLSVRDDRGGNENEDREREERMERDAFDELEDRKDREVIDERGCGEGGAARRDVDPERVPSRFAVKCRAAGDGRRARGNFRGNGKQGNFPPQQQSTAED